MLSTHDEKQKMLLLCIIIIIQYLFLYSLFKGICVEAMCNTTIQLPEHTAETCLHAIHALLESPWARAQVAKDPVLYKELLNVMHR